MENAREAVMEALERNAAAIRSGRSDWMRIADLFVLWLAENPDTESFEDFVWWIENESPEWVDEETSWEPFFHIPSRKGAILRFIGNWVNEEDIPAFMEFVKAEDERLWTFLTDDEIGEEEYF
jgi:hypothetical protein